MLFLLPASSSCTNTLDLQTLLRCTNQLFVQASSSLNLGLTGRLIFCWAKIPSSFEVHILHGATQESRQFRATLCLPARVLPTSDRLRVVHCDCTEAGWTFTEMIAPFVESIPRATRKNKRDCTAHFQRPDGTSVFT